MDKQVKSNNIHHIIEILRKDRVLVDGREWLYGALGLPNGTLPDVKTEYGFHSHGFLTKTLELWISHSGADATFGRLIEILENGGFKSVAGDVTAEALYSDQFDSVEGSIGVNSSSKDSTGFSFEIPEKALNFTGREQELKELHNTVMSGDGAVITALSGMGGIGKTTLAAQYVWKYHEEYFSNVVWINSENSTSLRGSFRWLAKKLNLLESEKNPTEKKFMVKVYEELAKSRTLIVFDNAESYDQIKPYLPKPVLKAMHPHVLLTSRNNKWNDKFNIIQVGLFSPEESVTFLKHYLGLTSQEEFIVAEKLCETLGYLPIAVRQAGAYIKAEKDEAIPRESTRQSLEKYLKIFEKDYKELLSYEYWKTTGEANEKTTYVTWTITMEKIKKENEMCEKIMEFIAYLDPNSISTGLLWRLNERTDRGRRPKDSSISSSTASESISDTDGVTLMMKSAINLLNQYSIIKKKEDGDISVHRLVQRVIRCQYRDRETDLLGKAIYIIDKFRSVQHYQCLWTCALEHEEIVERFTDFGIQACQMLTSFTSGNDEYADKIKLIKKTNEKFKTVHQHKGVYRLAVMCLEIILLCGYGTPNIENVDQISELGKEILLNSEELIRAEKSYSNIIGETAKSLSSFTERCEDKVEFWNMAYEFFKIYFNVLKFHKEAFNKYEPHNNTTHSMYISLMIKLNKTEEAVQMTRELAETTNRKGGGSGVHLLNLEYLADNLINIDIIGKSPHDELVKCSMELNEELYLSFKMKYGYIPKETLIHKVYCLFLLSDAGSKEEGLEICKAIIVEKSENYFGDLIQTSNKLLPVSSMLVEFGYLDAALKFFKLMRKHEKSLLFMQFEPYYFKYLLRKLDLETESEEEFEEILNKIILVLEREIEV